MSLKETLDAIWDRPGVMYPKHRCWFHSKPFGHKLADGLWVSAGRAVGTVRPRLGLGYSRNFPKWYGIAVAIRDGYRLI